MIEAQKTAITTTHKPQKTYSLFSSCLRVFLALVLCVGLIATLSTTSVLPSSSFHHSSFSVHPANSLFTAGGNISLTYLPDSLSTYVKWHASQRACIENSSCSHPLPPTLVWRCPVNRSCAGLGDRVRGIQVTFLIAVASKRLFFVEMPDDPFPFSDVVSPSFINWRLPDALMPDSQNWPHLDWFFCNGQKAKNRRRKCRKGRKMPHDRALPHVNISFRDIDTYKNDVSARLAPVPYLTVSCRLPGIILRHMFRNRRFAKHVPDLHPDQISLPLLLRLFIQLLFQPSPAVRSVINDTTPPDFVAQKYISVHARTGQDVGEQYDPRFEFVNSRMSDAVAELLQCVTRMHPIASQRIFIATDSVKFKDMFAGLARNTSQIDVRYIDKRAYHFGLRTARGKFNNRFKLSEKRLAFVNVFADMFMLGAGEEILTTGSGFATTAYWLGNAQRLLIAASGNGTDHCGYYLSTDTRASA